MEIPKDVERIIKAGQAAWKRIKDPKDKSWNDWMTVGEALLSIRQEAMNAAGIPVGTNRPPAGRTYNTAFGDLLRRFHLHDIDKADRSRLFDCMENRGAIEDWRNSLDQAQRYKFNHPSTVWRHWKKAMEEWKPAGAPAETKLVKTERELTRALEECDTLRRENRDLTARIAELEEELRTR